MIFSPQSLKKQETWEEGQLHINHTCSSCGNSEQLALGRTQGLCLLLPQLGAPQLRVPRTVPKPPAACHEYTLEGVTCLGTERAFSFQNIPSEAQDPLKRTWVDLPYSKDAE